MKISQKLDFVAEFPKKKFLGDSNEGKCLNIFEESAGGVSENDQNSKSSIFEQNLRLEVRTDQYCQYRCNNSKYAISNLRWPCGEVCRL